MESSEPSEAVFRGDLSRHDGRVTHPGFVALVGYRFGRWRGRLAAGAARRALRPPYVLLHRRVRNRYRIELHYTAVLGRRVRLSGRGDIVIGNRVVIGDDCTIGHGVTIGKTREEVPGWPVLGRGVVVGPGAAIVGDLHVGDGAVIGPNSVVLADVPAGARVSARPAVPDPSPVPPAVRHAPPVRSAPPRPSRSRLRVAGTAEVGRAVRTVPDGHASIADGVRLGDDCTLGYGVTVGWWPDQDGAPPAATLVGDRVVLGAGSVVLAGVHVGDDVRVGPNAVVTTDVPAGARLAAPPTAILRSLRTAVPSQRA